MAGSTSGQNANRDVFIVHRYAESESSCELFDEGRKKMDQKQKQEHNTNREAELRPSQSSFSCVELNTSDDEPVCKSKGPRSDDDEKVDDCAIQVSMRSLRQTNQLPRWQ